MLAELAEKPGAERRVPMIELAIELSELGKDFSN